MNKKIDFLCSAFHLFISLLNNFLNMAGMVDAEGRARENGAFEQSK